MVVQNVSKTTKSTRMVSARHSTHSASPETFTRSVSGAVMVIMLTQAPNAELPLWDAITSMVYALHAKLHSSIKDKLPLV